jgi:hypothetical protein
MRARHGTRHVRLAVAGLGGDRHFQVPVNEQPDHDIAAGCGGATADMGHQVPSTISAPCHTTAL